MKAKPFEQPERKKICDDSVRAKTRLQDRQWGRCCRSMHFFTGENYLLDLPVPRFMGSFIRSICPYWEKWARTASAKPSACHAVDFHAMFDNSD